MGRHASVPFHRRRWPWLLAAGIVVILLIALVTRLAGPGKPEAGPSTEPTDGGACGTVRVGVAPDVLPIMQEQAKQIADDCHRYEVVAIEPQAFGAAAASGKGVPNVWIPDSPLWVESLQKAFVSSKIDVPLKDEGQVATSPVVMAVPASIARPEITGTKPWLAVLAGVPLVTSAPGDSTPTVLAFTTVWQSLASNPFASSLMGDAFFQVVRGAVPPDTLITFADKPADQARVFPASEHQVFDYNAAHPETKLQTMVPESGPPTLQYQFVNVGTHDKGVAAGSAALLKHLRSAEATTAMQKAGLRAGKVTKEIVPGIPVELPGTPKIDVDDFDRMRLDWNRLSRDLRLLIAVDVSGSMKAAAGSSNRATLAADAVSESIKQMPPSSQAGLWVFSTSQQPGVDYRELVPVAPLGTAEDPASQRNVLLGASSRLPTMLQGDTGLYDTIWAAYQAQQRSFQPDVESMVVIITDGKNDDPPGGLSMEQLIANIKGVEDPNRPVRVVLLGMGPDTDEAAMKQITDAIGGETAVATDPAQLTGVFAAAAWQLTPGAWDQGS